MKRTIAALVIPFMMAAATSTISANKISSIGTQVQKSEVMDVATQSMYLMQTVVKDYLYIGSDMNSPVLMQEMNHSIQALNKQIDILKGYCSDNMMIENLLKSASIGRDELKEVLKEKYSADNIKLVLDLTTYISSVVLEVTEMMDREGIVYNSCSGLSSKYIGLR